MTLHEIAITVLMAYAGIGLAFTVIYFSNWWSRSYLRVMLLARRKRIVTVVFFIGFFITVFWPIYLIVSAMEDRSRRFPNGRS